MNNADFWASMHSIITAGFTPEGLLKLDSYAEQFISGRLVYQRFSPREQHGCAAGGTTNVIASLLAGAETGTDTDVAQALSEFERERQRTDICTYILMERKDEEALFKFRTPNGMEKVVRLKRTN